MLLDHREPWAPASYTPHAIEMDPELTILQASARVQSNLTGDKGKAVQPAPLPVSTVSCQRHGVGGGGGLGGRKAFNTLSSGLAHG